MKRALFAFLVALLVMPLGGHFAPSVYAGTALENALKDIGEEREAKILVKELVEAYGITPYQWVPAREAAQFMKRIKANKALADALVMARKLLTQADPGNSPYLLLDIEPSTSALKGRVVIGLKGSDADIIKALSIPNK